MIELRFEHIIDITKAMGLELEEVMYFAYPHPRQPPSESAIRLRELMGSVQAPALMQPAATAAPTPPTEEDLEKLMTKTLRKLFGEIAKVEGKETG